MSELPATPAATQTAVERRKLGLLQLGIAVVLTVLVVGLVLLNHQVWMLAFLVLVIPNVYLGIREMRASAKTDIAKP